MNIILCGPPLAGKTTLGKQVAEQLGWQFMDTDRLIENCYSEEESLTCREIHRKEGEDNFRRYETKALHSLKGSQKCVIALGGGSLNQAENANLLKKLGPIIYLKTSLQTLQSRLLYDRRHQTLPSYLENEANPLKKYEELVISRSVLYERYADITIETDLLSQTQIVSTICEYQYQYGK